MINGYLFYDLYVRSISFYIPYDKCSCIFLHFFSKSLASMIIAVFSDWLSTLHLLVFTNISYGDGFFSTDVLLWDLADVLWKPRSCDGDNTYLLVLLSCIFKYIFHCYFSVAYQMLCSHSTRDHCKNETLGGDTNFLRSRSALPHIFCKRPTFKR